MLSLTFLFPSTPCTLACHRWPQWCPWSAPAAGADLVLVRLLARGPPAGAQYYTLPLGSVSCGPWAELVPVLPLLSLRPGEIKWFVSVTLLISCGARMRVGVHWTWSRVRRPPDPSCYFMGHAPLSWNKFQTCSEGLFSFQDDVQPVNEYGLWLFQLRFGHVRGSFIQLFLHMLWNSITLAAGISDIPWIHFHSTV